MLVAFPWRQLICFVLRCWNETFRGRTPEPSYYQLSSQLPPALGAIIWYRWSNCSVIYRPPDLTVTTTVALVTQCCPLCQSISFQTRLDCIRYLQAPNSSELWEVTYFRCWGWPKSFKFTVPSLSYSQQILSLHQELFYYGMMMMMVESSLQKEPIILEILFFKKAKKFFKFYIF